MAPEQSKPFEGDEPPKVYFLEWAFFAVARAVAMSFWRSLERSEKPLIWSVLRRAGRWYFFSPSKKEAVRRKVRIVFMPGR